MKHKVNIATLPTDILGDEEYPQYQYMTISKDIENIVVGDWVICNDGEGTEDVLGMVSHIGKPFNFKNTLQIGGNPDLHVGRYILDYCEKVIGTNDPNLNDRVTYDGIDERMIPIHTSHFMARLPKSFVYDHNKEYEVEYWDSQTSNYLPPGSSKVKRNSDNTINVSPVDNILERWSQSEHLKDIDGINSSNMAELLESEASQLLKSRVKVKRRFPNFVSGFDETEHTVYSMEELLEVDWIKHITDGESFHKLAIGREEREDIPDTLMVVTHYDQEYGGCKLWWVIGYVLEGDLDLPEWTTLVGDHKDGCPQKKWQHNECTCGFRDSR